MYTVCHVQKAESQQNCQSNQMYAAFCTKQVSHYNKQVFKMHIKIHKRKGLHAIKNHLAMLHNTWKEPS